MYDPLAHQIGFSFITAYALEWLKRSKWFPWITVDSTTLNRYIGMLSAAATSIGLTFAADGTWAAGGVITIHVPPASVLLEALARFAGQAGLQHAIYEKLIRPTAPVFDQAIAPVSPATLIVMKEGDVKA